MTKKLSFGFILILIALSAYFLASTENSKPEMQQVNPPETYQECVDAGYPVQELYPPRCVVDDKVFTMDIGNKLELEDLIQVEYPQPNDLITSPLTITGQARGTWYFEATFPVTIRLENGEEITQSFATADGEWMTEEFVPFSAEISFTVPEAETGTLVLEKSNPSGLPENAQELRIPVRFK